MKRGSKNVGRNNHSPKVKRFSNAVIFVHWLNAVCFFMLYLSGLPMYTEWFDFLYVFFGGPENARMVHRVFAIGICLPVIIILIVDAKSFIYWIKTITRWSNRDVKFLLAFPKEFFGKNPKYPPQDFYNGGEKTNSILIILCTIMLVASGFVMWFPEVFPKALVRWAFPIHNIGFGLAAAVVIGHIFLALIHPNSRVSIKGMTTGYIPEWYAKAHHGQWYKEEMEKQEKGA